MYHSSRRVAEAADSDFLFPKTQSSAAENDRLESPSPDQIQQKLDSLLYGVQSFFDEQAMCKLNSAVLKSTFINKVACGERHVLFLTSSGFVYSMGWNDYGQLGNPCEEVECDDGSYQTISYQGEPSIIFGLLNQKVDEIACGTNHSAILSLARAGADIDKAA